MTIWLSSSPSCACVYHPSSPSKSQCSVEYKASQNSWVAHNKRVKRGETDQGVLVPMKTLLNKVSGKNWRDMMRNDILTIDVPKDSRVEAGELLVHTPLKMRGVHSRWLDKIKRDAAPSWDIADSFALIISSFRRSKEKDAALKQCHSDIGIAAMECAGKMFESTWGVEELVIEEDEDELKDISRMGLVSLITCCATQNLFSKDKCLYWVSRASRRCYSH